MRFVINATEKQQIDTYIVFASAEEIQAYEKPVEDLIDYMRSTRGFSGTFSETAILDFAGEKTPGKYLFVGMDAPPAYTHDPVRKLFTVVARQLSKMKAVNIEIPLGFLETGKDDEAYGYVLALVEALSLTLYRYDRYLSKKKPITIETFYLSVPEALKGVAERAREEAEVLVSETCAARDLVNKPSNQQTPQQLGEQAKALCEGLPIECSVYDEKRLAELGMKAVLAVGQASPNPPRLIVLRYKGNPDSDEIIGLVGKGVTFDSGGLSLKAKGRLAHMKHDMAGAAAVIGAMTAIAKRKLVVNVTAVVAAVENLLSGNGYKPGDIIGSMAGKSILIISTDGEGRLTFADAITYAVREERVSCVYDIATLTGGARAIFGGYINPVLSNSDRHYAILDQASQITGERVQRLPIMPEARALLDCDVADILNSTDKPVMRMQQGGMFIYEFVQASGDIPWVHTDMSGGGLADTDLDYTPAGGTGRGVRNLYHVAKLFSQDR